MENKNWTPTQEDNVGIITRLYESIKEELYELQEATACADKFIYDFIRRIQNEWHPNSCHTLVINKKRIN